MATLARQRSGLRRARANDSGVRGGSLAARAGGHCSKIWAVRFAYVPRIRGRAGYFALTAPVADVSNAGGMPLRLVKPPDSNPRGKPQRGFRENRPAHVIGRCVGCCSWNRSGSTPTNEGVAGKDTRTAPEEAPGHPGFGGARIASSQHSAFARSAGKCGPDAQPPGCAAPGWLS